MWGKQWKTDVLRRMTSPEPRWSPFWCSLMWTWASHFSSIESYRFSWYLHIMLLFIWCSRKWVSFANPRKRLIDVPWNVGRTFLHWTSHFICRQREDESFLLKGTLQIEVLWIKRLYITRYNSQLLLIQTRIQKVYICYTLKFKAL